MALSVQPFTLTIPSDLTLLPLARGFVEAMCRYHRLDRCTTDAIVVATSEAVSNVMRHAHRDRPDATVQIQYYAGREAVEILLLDEGEPFDLDAVPALLPGEIRIGGRGVFLMRTLMDELSCQRRGDSGNALRMVKRCPADSPGRNAS